jgi:hypothetical protein
MFEDVRLTAFAAKGRVRAERIVGRLEAAEERPAAATAQVEVLASILAAPDYCFAVKVCDDWFVVRRGGEKPLVERLRCNRHWNDVFLLGCDPVPP